MRSVPRGVCRCAGASFELLNKWGDADWQGQINLALWGAEIARQHALID